MKIIIAASLCISITFAGGVGIANAAPAKYKTCAEMQKKYTNGVAFHKGPASKTDIQTPVVNRNVYLANQKLDRDEDGVACEVLIAAAPPTVPTVPTIAVTPTGVPEVDALVLVQANSGTLTQDQATLLYVVTGSIMKMTTASCPNWGNDVFRQGYLNSAATPRVLAAYRLGPEHLPWFRSQLEQMIPMVCRYSGYPL